METMLTLKVTATIESIDQQHYLLQRDLLIKSIESLVVSVDIESEEEQ